MHAIELLMPCTGDRYFAVDECAAREAALIPGATLLPIDSAWGHRAGDPGRPGQEEDAEFLSKHAAEFLAVAADRA